MSKNIIKIRKGADIKLKGKANNVLFSDVNSETYALKPTDFHGIIPRLSVKIGDEVKAGSVLFKDKKNEALVFCSPVSGEIVDIIRGDRRALLEIKILADKEIKYLDCGKADIQKLSKEQVIEKLMNSGLWPYIMQRPFSVIADPTKDCKSFFVSGFDSSPLAPDYGYALEKDQAYLQTGFDVIRKLTDGKVYLGLDADKNNPTFLENIQNVEKHYFSGKHPKGNVGVQIHHIDPINKGEQVWYTDIWNLVYIGKLFSEGIYDVKKRIAVTGSELNETGYAEVISGCSIKNIVQNRLSNTNVRIISGNVLTGDKIPSDGYLGFYHNQLTVIPESTEPEFFGWAIPNPNKLSFSRALLSWLTPNKEYRLNTALNGEERAFVVTGEMEKFLPMDIYPMQLLKSILVKDIERMENLGIYEIAPEDFALCEFANTSKIDIQKLVREGLDLIKEEC